MRMPFGWRALVELPPSLVDEVERREGRALAALLVGFMLLGGVFLAAQAATLAQEGGLGNLWALILGFVAYVTTAVAYVLTRHGHARLGALMLVSIVVLSSWTFNVVTRAPVGYTVLVGAVFAMAFLRPLEIAVLHVLNLLFLSLHQVVVPAPVGEWIIAVLVYLVAISALTVRRYLTDISLERLDHYATELRAVLETSDAAIVSLDPEYRILSFNGTAQRFLDACCEATLEPGRSAFQVVPPTTHAAVVSLVAPCLRGETVREVREVRTLDGGVLHVDATLKPMVSRNGDIVGVSALVRDVTEERQAREEAERRIVETRSAVLNAASHELNTPLTPLVLQLTLLRQGHLGPVPGNQRAALDKMDRSVRQLRRNVEAFLHATRLEQALAHAGSGVVDVGDLVRAWASTSSGDRVVESLACDRGVRVAGDSRLLYVALRSLVDTVLRWSRDERVSVSVTAREGEAVLTVADPTSGVGQEDLRSMEALMGEMETLVGYAGLLSLHVARRVVTHHGGRMRMYHDEGLRLEAFMPLAPRFMEPGERPSVVVGEGEPEVESLLPPRPTS